MPRAVSASSNASDCALMRNSTAISDSGTPRWRSVRISAATASASATSSSYSRWATFGPDGRWAASFTPCEAVPDSSVLAAATTSGVER